MVRKFDKNRPISNRGEGKEILLERRNYIIQKWDELQHEIKEEKQSLKKRQY